MPRTPEKLTAARREARVGSTGGRSVARRLRRCLHAAILATAMLAAAWVPDARPAPAPAPDSLSGRAGAAIDPANLWTFDSGG